MTYFEDIRGENPKTRLYIEFYRSYFTMTQQFKKERVYKSFNIRSPSIESDDSDSDNDNNDTNAKNKNKKNTKNNKSKQPSVLVILFFFSVRCYFLFFFVCNNKTSTNKQYTRDIISSCTQLLRKDREHNYSQFILFSIYSCVVVKSLLLVSDIE